jgi:lysophospholipase L1-like esterase
MRRRVYAAVLVCLTAAFPASGTAMAAPAVAEKPADPPPERWAKQVEAYEKRDAEQSPPEGGIVFAGSSTVRMWPDLAKAFAPTPVVGRGIGGSHISDQIHWAERLVLRYRPTQIVLYAGDNDVAGGKKAERVLADFQRFVATVRRALPEVWVHFLAIKPSPKREALWPEMKRANGLVAKWAKNEPRVTYIDVASPMLDAEGRPRRDIFLKDMLHMNADGYALWVPRVKEALRKAAEAEAGKPGG